MSFRNKSIWMGGIATLAMLATAGVLIAKDAVPGTGQENPIPSNWNNYPTKNVGNLPNTSGTLDTSNSTPQGNVQNPSVETTPQNPQYPPQYWPEQPRWPVFPPQQQQSKPKPPSYGKPPHGPPMPPPGYQPPGVQWNKPNGFNPGQQGMLQPNQMDPEFLKWLNQIYEMWQMHQAHQNGERQGGPAGGATPSNGPANFIVD